MRYERKYIFDEYSIEYFRSKIKSLGFNVAYPTRQVSSVYYDTFDFYLFRISEAGIADRKKIRLRWYNFEEEIKLEYKIKKSEIGNKIYPKDSKESSSFLPLSLELPKNKFKSIINIPNIVDNIFSPKVVVTYKRDYFVSNCGETRLTLDYQINYAMIIKNFSNFSISYWFPEESSVLELKYDYVAENDTFIQSIVNKLSIQTSRFSKYCRAISSVYC